VAAICILEPLVYSFYLHRVSPPPHDLDAPFQVGCADPLAAATAYPREKAALVMLARNSELDNVIATAQNIDVQFNRWFNYPLVLLNDEPFTDDFVARVTASLPANRTIRFETIPSSHWGFPSHISPQTARGWMADLDRQGVFHGGEESYHHMCRFYSGTFFTLPALKDYRWYWRLEPGVQYTCAITYDPFAAMARHGKVYGFTTALWEVPETCPSLFREVDAFAHDYDIPQGVNWDALLDMESGLFGIGPPVLWKRWLAARRGDAHWTKGGDRWNLCHYWSNFEIADLNFFRGEQYQALFRYLDEKGGFYRERWGDAPVHSLAVHLLLPPEKLHHFADFGYLHEPFYQCPGNAPNGQLRHSKELGLWEEGNYSEEMEGSIGCRCLCKEERRRNLSGYCLEKLQAPAAARRMSWWDRQQNRFPYSIGMPGRKGEEI